MITQRLVQEVKFMYQILAEMRVDSRTYSEEFSKTIIWVIQTAHENEKLINELKTFVSRCEEGSIRSRKTRAKFQKLIEEHCQLHKQSTPIV